MESSISSVEMVRCSTRADAETVETLMKRHSVAYQCHPKAAWSTSIFEGELVKTDLKAAAKLTKDEESGVFTFKNYLKKWSIQDEDARKSEQELEEYHRKFNAEVEKSSKSPGKQEPKPA
jgi:hypothetical protein